MIFITTFLVFIFRKTEEDQNLKDEDDKGSPLNITENTEVKNQKLTFNLRPNTISDKELGNLREKTARKNRIKKIFKEVIIYVLFLWLQYQVLYLNVDTESFSYQAKLKSLFSANENDGLNV